MMVKVMKKTKLEAEKASWGGHQRRMKTGATVKEVPEQRSNQLQDAGTEREGMESQERSRCL